MKSRKLTVPDAAVLIEAIEANGELAAVVFVTPQRIYIREGSKVFAYDVGAIRAACITQARAA